MTLILLTNKLRLINLVILLCGLLLSTFAWSLTEEGSSDVENSVNSHSNENTEIDKNQSTQAESTQHIIITSRKSPLAGLAPTTQSTFLINPEKLPKMANSITELVEGTPGVAENSQPGLFQVLSIRGVSRQRILTLLDGVRLSSERRAGTSASFIDPSLLQGISVTRGPSSTYYGSGAMGGVIQLDLKQIFGEEFTAGFDSVGNENFQNYSWGAESDSSTNHLSIVRRQANNSDDINNNPLNTHFEQVSGIYQNSLDVQDLSTLTFLNQSKIDSWFFTSKGTDLGRSNSRFPNRIINIPDESHHIIKSSISSLNQWSADFYFHDQSITTQTIRPNQSIIDVTNESIDYGINWQLGWDNKTSNNKNKWLISNLFGVDLYVRENVNSMESKNDLIENRLTNSQTLVDASKNELAAFYSYHFQYKQLRFQAGGRFTSEHSKNTFSDSQSNSALTAFAGLAYNLREKNTEGSNFEINANIGNAFRFPSLTELYFSGTTARGEIIGNADLRAEESINFEVGINWNNKLNLLKMTLFENNFDQYIERITTGTNVQGDDILTFVNQQNGTIKGIEAEYQLALSQRLDLNFIATFIEGKNEQHEALADIPSDRTSLSLSYQENSWNAQIKLQHRLSKRKFGNGELATQSANLLSASFQYQLNQNWLIKFVGENLLDTEYVGSADDLATLMPGRSFGLNIIWNND